MQLTRAAPDPVWPVLLTLVLTAALAALRAVHRAGLHSMAMALSPRAVVGTLFCALAMPAGLGVVVFH